MKRELSPEQLGRATVFFPIVGIIIGGVLAGLNWVCSRFLPAEAVNALLVLALVLLTGGIHLDGLADTCDGMAGHKPVEERWRIMRDSRTGAFGVVGIAVVLLLKYAFLNGVAAGKMTGILLLVPVASRWAMVYAIFAFRYARPQGLGSAYKAATRFPQFIIATVLALGITAAIYPLIHWAGFITLGSVWLAATALAFYFKYKFTGLTGDTYGAINESGEAAGLMVMAAICFKGAGLI